jgi:hypothetical protein
MPIVGQFGSLAGFGVFPGGALESIATVTVPSGGAFTVSFSSIPQTYQHLQVRCSVRSTLAIDYHAMYMTFNGTGGTSYSHHRLNGDGQFTAATATASTSAIEVGFMGAANYTSNFGSSIVDILDYSTASKNRVVRSFAGVDNNGNGVVGIWSGMLVSTTAVTSIDFYVGGGGAPIAQHSTLALYGVRG